MAKHTHGSHLSPPKLKRKRMTLIALNQGSAVGPTLRNPTAAITAKGGLIAKTRKPA